MAPDVLPQTARAIALLLASNPAVQDAHPGVVHQLLEFSHRYTHQVLSDALVYSEHAGHGGKLELDDVLLAVQARVGWEMGGRTPKEYILSLATQVNSTPLPAVPEVFGVRLPPAKDCLTAVDFDLVPNKPPPGVQLYEEEIVEETDDEGDQVEDDEDDDDEMEEMDVTAIADGNVDAKDKDVASDGLFEGDGDDDDDLGDVAMHGETIDIQPEAPEADLKRTLVEDDDYD